VESFNKLMMRAKTASIKFSEEERVNRFLASLPSSYKSLRRSFRMLDATKRTWEEAMVQFNMEVSDARRDAEGAAKEKGSAQKGSASTARRKAIGPKTAGPTTTRREREQLGRGRRDRATIGLDQQGSKWRWDEDYGMSSNESDDDHNMPGRAQKSQPQGWSSSCGRLLDPEQLSTERSVDHTPNLLRTELMKCGGQNRSGRMSGLKLKMPIIDHGTNEAGSARKTSIASAKKISIGDASKATSGQVI